MVTGWISTCNGMFDVCQNEKSFYSIFHSKGFNSKSTNKCSSVTSGLPNESAREKRKIASGVTHTHTHRLTFALVKKTAMRWILKSHHWTEKHMKFSRNRNTPLQIYNTAANQATERFSLWEKCLRKFVDGISLNADRNTNGSYP